jgi:hypothetical protein
LLLKPSGNALTSGCQKWTQPKKWLIERQPLYISPFTPDENIGDRQ